MSWITEEWLEQAVHDTLAALLAPDSGVTLRGTVTVSVHPSPHNLRVRVPLRIEVPQSFDADADLDLRFCVAARDGAPSVWLYQFEVDVRWVAWQETIALPTVEKVLRRLLRALLGHELERRLAATLAEEVRRLCPPEDGYRLHSIWNDERAIEFRCCPSAARVLRITMRAFPAVAIREADLEEGVSGARSRSASAARR